jgi:hypothetical protein
MKSLWMRSLLLSSLAALGTACATTTEIVTKTPGATVVRESDQKELGVTPLKYTTSMWLWESEKLKVTSRRGVEKTIEIKRSEVDYLPMGGGACLTLTGVGCVAGVPIILAGGMKLPEKTEVKFDDAKTEKNPTKASTASTKKKLASRTAY